MKILKFAPLLFFLGGCSILEPTPGGRSANAPTAEQWRLASLLRTYRLSEQSIPPTPHPNPVVDAAIKSMFSVAEKQKLVFDGSRASDGNVIVGRRGATDQMLVGLNVYPVADKVAYRDVTNWKLADVSEGTSMQRQFENALPFR